MEPKTRSPKEETSPREGSAAVIIRRNCNFSRFGFGELFIQNYLLFKCFFISALLFPTGRLSHLFFYAKVIKNLRRKWGMRKRVLIHFGRLSRDPNTVVETLPLPASGFCPLFF